MKTHLFCGVDAEEGDSVKQPVRKKYGSFQKGRECSTELVLVTLLGAGFRRKMASL